VILTIINAVRNLRWHTVRAVKAQAVLSSGNIDKVPVDLIAEFIAMVGGRHLISVVLADLPDNFIHFFNSLALGCRDISNSCAVDCAALTRIEALLRSCSVSPQALVVQRSKTSESTILLDYICQI
jgi:hypothetical protein